MTPLFFRSKVNRIVDPDKISQDTEERVPLEKGDKAAMAIAAVIVFVPALLVLCGIFIGVSALFVR